MLAKFSYTSKEALAPRGDMSSLADLLFFKVGVKGSLTTNTTFRHPFFVFSVIPFRPSFLRQHFSCHSFFVLVFFTCHPSFSARKRQGIFRL